MNLKIMRTSTRSRCIAIAYTLGKHQDAPFRDDWHEYVLKRLLRMAAEGDYDYMAWTTGAMQAERYKLSNQIGSIQVYRNYQNGKPVETYQVYVVDPQGYTKNQLTEYSATREHIAEIFGKDLGARLMTGRTRQKARYLKLEAWISKLAEKYA
jgi:hypothetical protein